MTRIEDMVTKFYEGIMNDGRNENSSNLGPELLTLSTAFSKSPLDDSDTEEEHNIWYSLCITYVELRQPDVTAERAALLQSQIPFSTRPKSGPNITISRCSAPSFRS